MGASKGLFVKQYTPAGGGPAVGTSAIEARRALAGLFAETKAGQPRTGILAQTATDLVSGTATMSYALQACTPVISRAANEGVYVFSFQGVTSAPTTSAPGADSRWDLIYVKQNDVEKGDPNNSAILGVIQGTAAPTPAKPTASVPAGAYVIAEARVYAGATATNSKFVELTQLWKHTALRGAALPVRNTTERTALESTIRTGESIQRLDIPGLSEVWDGKTWFRNSTLQHAEYAFNASPVPPNVPTGVGPGTLDAARSRNASIFRWKGKDVIEVLEEGVYAVSLHAEFGYASPATGDNFLAFQRGNTGETLHTANVPPNSGGFTLTAANIYLNPETGDNQLRIIFTQSTGGTRHPSGRVKITRIN